MVIDGLNIFSSPNGNETRNFLTEFYQELKMFQKICQVVNFNRSNFHQQVKKFSKSYQNCYRF